MKYILESLNNAGTENYIYNILKNNKSHCLVDLVILGHVDEDFLIKIKPFINEVNFIPKNKLINKYKWLYSILKEDNKELIHCHLYSSLLPSVILAKIAKKKIVATFHMPLSKWGVKIKLSWVISLLFIDQLITVSTAVKNEIVKFRKNIEVCYAPVEVFNVKSSRCNNEIFEIIGIGRLSQEKDWPTLIKAIHTLKQKKFNNLRLTICGGGPDELMLKDMINDFDLNDEVTLTGHLDKKSIEQAISQSDLFVLPSKFEGFGIAPVEAMQMGLPTITANYPASQDYITPGVTGWTFPIGDSNALAELIEHLMSNKTHREQVAKQGQVVALDKFSPKQIAEQHLEIYSKLTSYL
ncbi:TPA: glycosyltransferase family 4 protein [Vibrio parahaemolyticus]|nr:glycosyltransferase family 4 protein [Vibrio parahaemolyticus]